MEVARNASETPQSCPAETELAGRSRVCEGCPGQALCQSQGGADPDQSAIDLRMGAVKHKLLVLSGKGGVGKSTVSVHLAHSLALSGARVGLLDLDICGPSVCQMMGVSGQSVVSTQYGWKPLVSPVSGVKVMSVAALLASDTQAVTFRGPRKTGLIKQLIKDTFWGRLDYLIFDTPPGTSDEHLSVVKFLKSTKPEGVILVTTPQDVSLDTIRKEFNFCHKMGLSVLGIVENMAGFCCPCCKEEYEIFQGTQLQDLCKKYGVSCLGKIPLTQEIGLSCEEGRQINKSSSVINHVENIRQRLQSLLLKT